MVINESVEIVVILGLPVNDKTIIANKFNEYFTNIGPALANKIPDSAVSPVPAGKLVRKSLQIR